MSFRIKNKIKTGLTFRKKCDIKLVMIPNLRIKSEVHSLKYYFK